MGATQYCKPGDWLVDNQGDCYTTDKDSFAATYTGVSPGVYQKCRTVWARPALETGSIRTKEGSTNYSTGGYLVSNNIKDSDPYAVSKTFFEHSYDQVPE